MDLSQDDVIEILKYVKESIFDELHLETGDLKIVVRKHGAASSHSSKPQESVYQRNKNPLSVHGEPPPESAANSIVSDSATRNEKKKICGETELKQGLVAIKSPMLGTFYRCSNEGEPPLEDLASVVTEETAVCVIEVMKLFSTITAGIRGKITEICAEDGQMVEYDQILFMVDPRTG